MSKSRRIVHCAMLVPVIGWGYLMIGIMHPPPGKVLQSLRLKGVLYDGSESIQ